MGQPEVVVGALDSLLYCFDHDGTAHGTGFPFNCRGKIRATAAVGDADGDGLPEIAVACADTGLVWLLTGDGAVESGWPITLGIGAVNGSRGGVTMGDVTGDEYPEIIWASKTDSVFVYDGSGSRVTWVAGVFRYAAIIYRCWYCGCG